MLNPRKSTREKDLGRNAGLHIAYAKPDESAVWYAQVDMIDHIAARNCLSSGLSG
jgi:hypothetical protein